MPMPSCWRAVCLNAAIILLFIPSLASSQEEAGPSITTERTAIVTTITSTISIDGNLDEPAWRTSPDIGALVQREPDNGRAPSQGTRVVLLRDASALYIGVMCYDSEPDRIVASQMSRDAGLGSDDRITIVLDTYRDQRDGFYFQTNAGALLARSRRR